MANLKNITELPLAESTENLNLIVSDNGVAKQIAASALGVGGTQSDWNETDETSPAFIMNKPESLGGGKVVSYRYSGNLWYREDGGTMTVTEQEVIDNFFNGVVRFKDISAPTDYWGTMVGYYYTASKFALVYTSTTGLKSELITF